MTSLPWHTSFQDVQCHAICTLGKTNKCWLGFATNVFLLGLTIASNFCTIQYKFLSVFDGDHHLIFRFRETKIYPDILVQSGLPFTSVIKVNRFQLCERKPGFTRKFAEWKLLMHVPCTIAQYFWKRNRKRNVPLLLVWVDLTGVSGPRKWLMKTFLLRQGLYHVLNTIEDVKICRSISLSIFCIIYG